MAKELSENTNVQVSLKTLGGIAALIATIVGMWFALQADIEEAKEFDMKDQLVRQTIMDTQKDVEEIKKTLEKIEDKLYGR
jgi:hypothetical protein